MDRLLPPPRTNLPMRSPYDRHEMYNTLRENIEYYLGEHEHLARHAHRINRIMAKLCLEDSVYRNWIMTVLPTSDKVGSLNPGSVIPHRWLHVLALQATLMEDFSGEYCEQVSPHGEFRHVEITTEFFQQADEIMTLCKATDALLNPDDTAPPMLGTIAMSEAIASAKANPVQSKLKTMRAINAPKK